MKKYEEQSYLSSAAIYRPVFQRRSISDKPGPRRESFTEQPPVVYGEDTRVFLYLPEASSVEMSYWADPEGKKYALEKDGDSGYWYRIIDAEPGFHYVDFFVDGRFYLDPLVPIGYGSHRAANFIEVPDPDFDLDIPSDVPHGMTHLVNYASAMTDEMRCAYVYTPPAYMSGTERYPVLYLFHGGGENEAGWLWQGKADRILDKMIARGLCKPMIVVMDNFQAFKRENRQITEQPIAELFRDELIPLIDRTFRTRPEADARAIAGLSMGGLRAKEVAFALHDEIHSLGIFSSGAGFTIKGVSIWGEPYDYSDVLRSPEYYAGLFRVTMVTCGESDPRIEYTRPQVAQLQAEGYPILFHSYPGSHEWHVWRKSLVDFLKVLF